MRSVPQLPRAAVRVLRPAKGIVRVEVECPSSMTSAAIIAPTVGPAVKLTDEALVSLTVLQHTAKCGACDASEARGQIGGGR